MTLLWAGSKFSYRGDVTKLPPLKDLPRTCFPELAIYFPELAFNFPELFTFQMFLFDHKRFSRTFFISFQNFFPELFHDFPELFWCFPELAMLRKISPWIPQIFACGATSAENRSFGFPELSSRFSRTFFFPELSWWFSSSSYIFPELASNWVIPQDFQNFSKMLRIYGVHWIWSLKWQRICFMEKDNNMKRSPKLIYE